MRGRILSIIHIITILYFHIAGKSVLAGMRSFYWAKRLRVQIYE